MSKKILEVDSLDKVRSGTTTSHLESFGFMSAESEREIWFMAVSEAWRKTMFPMNEPIRKYTVLLLETYNREHIDFVNTLQNFCRYCQSLSSGDLSVEPMSLKKMADSSLLYVSLYRRRELSRKELRSFSFISGQSAELFWSLGSDDASDLGEAYREIAQHYEMTSTILSNLRVLSSEIH